MGKFFEVSKTGIYLKEPCQVYKCSKFQEDILKNARVLVFLRSKRPFFKLFPAISVFSRFSKFVLFEPFKKCSRVVFRVLEETLTQKYVSRRPNPKFSV